MNDEWITAHLSGEHQDEIIAVMEAIDPALRGHPRIINALALIRTLAAMLGPADQDTRERFLEALVPSLRAILARLDEMMAAQRRRP